MNDLNKKSVEELKKLEEESRAELFALRFQSAMGNLEKPHRIGELKKQIARILTILSARKNDGENTAINVKINLSETYAKIEKESQAFAEKKTVSTKGIGTAEKKVAISKATTSAAKGTKTDKDVALKTLIKENDVAKKTAAKSKTTTPSGKATVTVKSVTSAKAEIEVPKGAKKAALTKTAKKVTELNAKEKLVAIKSSVAMGGIAKGRGLGVKIDLDLKTKNPKATEYTYGTNWKENRDKILTTGKTTKKTDEKTTKKGIGKNNGKK